MITRLFKSARARCALILISLSTVAGAAPTDPTEFPEPHAAPPSISFSETGTGCGCGASARPDGHGPIGVMGDHMHTRGKWMVSLRAMRMHMEGMRDGTDGLSRQEVLAEGFLVTPTEMDMDMVMLGAMYAPSDDWTLTAMLPYVRKEMEHVDGMGAEFTAESEGLGDVRVGGLYRVLDRGGHRLLLNLGLSLPTGAIDVRDDAHHATNSKLPYPMQLGTGTFDLLPGATYVGQGSSWSFGLQAIPRLHLGENDEGYRRGNRVDATAWLARRLGAASVSGRVAFAHWGRIHGADDDLDPNMIPTADPTLQGGDRVDLLLGLNWATDPGSRLALEVGAPVWQDLDGPQLETDWIATFGWQVSF